MIFESKRQQTMTPWLMPFSKEGNGRLRLFFFPHAGSGASSFTQWSTILAPYFDCYAIQLPGRESRQQEPPHQEIQPLIHTLTDVLQSYLNEPFVFWGHSMGALLSFEVARKLQQRDLPIPQQLIISGCNAPHTPYEYPHIHHLPKTEFVAFIQKFSNVSPTVLQNVELQNLILPTLRADFKLVETYAYQAGEPLPCPITILNGLSDKKTNPPNLQEWQKQTTMPLEMFTFPGNHFFLYDHQPALANQIVKSVFNHEIQFTQETTGDSEDATPHDMQPNETHLDKQADTRTTKQTQLSARRQNLSTKQQTLLEKWKSK